MNVTIVIPTHNRHFYLKRLIQFYSKQSADVLLKIVDSSEDSNALDNKTFFENLKREQPQFRCEYNHTREHFPGYAKPVVHDKVMWALDRVTTPFVAMCADDDFLIPAAVKKCGDFLRSNAEYCCARGQIFDFITDKKKSFELYPALHYKSIESDDASERAWLASRYYQQTFYGVFRVEILKAVHSKMSERFIRQPSWADELAMSTYSAALGKIRRIDEPYEYRELHDENFGHKVARWPEMIFEESHRPFLADYIDGLTDLILCSSPGLKPDEARRSSISTLIGFSKWYFDIRYRDSHNRPKGSDSLENRGIVKKISDRFILLERKISHYFSVRSAISLKETQDVIRAVTQN